MMNILRGMVIAFAMYSRLPMPRVDWTPPALRYALWMLPLVGLIEGSLLLCWWQLALFAGIDGMLLPAGLVLLPVLYTGGIHLDGFCDTADALASHADRARKLAILKDSHIGAFAAIGLGCYLLLDWALWDALALSWRTMGMVVLGTALVRMMGAASLILLPKARPDGLGQTFAAPVSSRATWVWLCMTTLLLGGGLLACSLGGGLWVLAGLGILCLAYRRMALRQFGGVTGDLSGWLVEMGGLTLLFLLVIGQRMGVIAR